MKLGQVIKLDKRNKTMSKKFDDGIISENCDVIAIFPVYDQFGSIWKLDSGRIICKTDLPLTITFYLTKLKTELKNL